VTIATEVRAIAMVVVLAVASAVAVPVAMVVVAAAVRGGEGGGARQQRSDQGSYQGGAFHIGLSCVCSSISTWVQDGARRLKAD
jgi:hypothetical protein